MLHLISDLQRKKSIEKHWLVVFLSIDRRKQLTQVNRTEIITNVLVLPVHFGNLGVASFDVFIWFDIKISGNWKFWKRNLLSIGEYEPWMLCPGEFVGIRWRFSDSKLWLFNLFIWCWVRKDDLFLANATLSKITFIKPKIIGLRIQTLLSNSSFIKCSGVREVEAAKYVSDERTNNTKLCALRVCSQSFGIKYNFLRRN